MNISLGLNVCFILVSVSTKLQSSVGNIIGNYLKRFCNTPVTHSTLKNKYSFLTVFISGSQTNYYYKNR